MKRKSINIEAILVRISEQGDQLAFREFFDTFYPRLLHFSFSLIRNSVLAEEIVLDVFASVWKKKENLKNVGHIESYLFTATKNRTLNAVRDKKKDLLNLELDCLDFKFMHTKLNPESQLISQELYEEINKAIDALPEKGRMIYRMIKDEGMNYKQVAELLDISAKTVDSHLYTAVKRIRTTIEQYLNNENNRLTNANNLEIFFCILSVVDYLELFVHSDTSLSLA